MLDKQDVEYCQYLITIGGSLGLNLGSAHSIRALSRARERGIKLVVVDPRCSQEATQAAEWISIRPGNDLAFSLALLHVELYEVGIFDVPFLKGRKNAVYLIGADGCYAKDSLTGKPLIWDPLDRCAKTFDDPSTKDFALEGRYQVAGQTLATAFTLVKEAIHDYTPEWAEKLTTVPATTIRRFLIKRGGVMPKHTNTVEHEQFVLRGRACLNINMEVFKVKAGDVIFIPEGAPHWYVNNGDEDFEFLCIIPNKRDEIRLVEDNSC